MKVHITVSPSEGNGGESQIVHMIKMARNVEEEGFIYGESFYDFDEAIRVLKSFNELIKLSHNTAYKKRKLPSGNAQSKGGE